MHHKIIGEGLGSLSPNGPRFTKRSRLMGGFGNEYESDDEDEFNMTSVNYNHIPLTPGLSHAVRLELGSNPNLVLGPERKVSDADDETSTSSSSEESSNQDYSGPAEIQPLYQEEPTSSMEPKSQNQLRLEQKKDNPMFLYNTTRSRDVLQLQLAMQKQTEFDEENRDMDHRLHCIYKFQKKATPPPSRKRSRSNSPVPQTRHIEFSPPQAQTKPHTKPPTKQPSKPQTKPQSKSQKKGRETPVRAPARNKLKSPPAAAITSGNGTPPTTARGSPILLESYTRRPHKNKRGNTKAKEAKQTKSSKKKSPPKRSSPAKQEEDEEDDSRFKRFQNTQWHEKFMELMKFRKVNGHCQVPHTWPPNPQLARWVKRQRYQFKLRCEGKMSTMTEDRVQLLNEVGFVWDSHAAAWQEKYEELKDYVATYKTFNMGNSYATHPQLATWVKCQRRQYKLLMMGQESNMTAERKELLEKLGFLWGVRNVKK